MTNNKKNKLKGGTFDDIEIINKEYTISYTIAYKNKEFNLILTEDDESTYINIGRLPEHCGKIHIFKDDINAQLDHVEPISECSKPSLKIPSEGYIMIELIIKFLKYLKNNLKIKNIILTDYAYIYCNNNKLNLSKMYILTHGYPWYYKFGFKSYKYHMINLNNKKIIDNIKNDNINISKILDELIINKSEKFKKFINDEKEYLIDKFKNKNQFIKDTLNIISKEKCILFMILIDKFYEILKLKYIEGDTLIYEL